MSDLSEPLKAGALRPTPRAPIEGSMHVDRDGFHWLCQAVIESSAIDGYFLVRLMRVENGKPVGEPLVLVPSEYEAFARDRLLRVDAAERPLAQQYSVQSYTVDGRSH